MKPILHPALVNGPLGDPGLCIQFMHQKRIVLFDLGDISALANGTLLKVSHVFVSHTHIDHFIGFDRLLRIAFGRDKTIVLFGPENFIANVAGKLAGFTWNLVEHYAESITLDVVEVREDHLFRARFRAIDRFKRADVGREPFIDGVLLDEPEFTVRAQILEHRVPCLGFALKEKLHVNILQDRLEALNYVPGAWLNELKLAVLSDAPETPIAVPVADGAGRETRTLSAGILREQLISVAPGQKIAYVTDVVYTDGNRKRIVDLVRDADVFFCESPFLAEEEERARDRRHLTSRQAGLLAREAGVRRLEVFHFSQKHALRTDQLYREAHAAFTADG
jgi:ribonuclease Z